MTQIIRALVHPIFYLLHKVVRRFFLLFIISATVATIIFLTNRYTSSEILPQIFGNSPLSQQETEPENVIKEITVQKGDTIGGILRKQNLPNEDIQALIKLSQAESLTSNLKVGQNISFDYEIEIVETPESDLNEEKLLLNRMVFKIDKLKSIEFVKQDGKFTTHHITTPLKKLVTNYSATIDSSVMASLKNAGMSTNSIVKLINAYSHQIDFQRQIRSGDKINVITEKFVTEDGEFSHHGRILYASLQTQNDKNEIYLYSPDGKEENEQFFSAEGNSIKTNLLRTPVNVVRVSSNFGIRKHPVLGYSKMHKGVDFSAAPGTPIYAAGKGTVEFIGWKSGYGRFVVLKHNGQLSTAYAHASKFAKNLKRGSRVKQGEIIAYVGSSGRTTGPHLHYEVRVNGKQVNPMKFKSIPGVKLTGEKLAKFNKHKDQVEALKRDLIDKIEIAATNVNLF
jgi:murein DD-endopeptidase MepM/ murein hydrolase activator NlpD